MGRRSLARALTVVILLILPTISAGSVAGPAHALPGDAADVPDTAAVTLAWPTLGLATGMVLGPDSPTTFTVPVPAGLTVARLQGTFHLPMNIGAGFLEIDDGDGNLLASVDLPPAASIQVVTPFDVDISAARIRASSVDLSFTVRRLDGSNQFCGPLQQLALSGLATVFTGTEPPVTTVADFFPAVLEHVTIYTPIDAEAAEQQSVLMLVSTLARLYRSQPLTITVANQGPGAIPPPAPQLSRSIVVETGQAGLSVVNAGNPDAYLRVSGHGDELITQVSLLVNGLQTLAQVAAVRIDQPGSDSAPSGDTLTFSQLKLSGKTDVLRTSSLSVGVDRAVLGNGRFDRVQVHLLADYTPVPKDDTAAVLIRAGGVVVYRSLLDNTGVLDATFNLESQTIGRGINLDFALTYTPRETCGPLIAPITFQIDPRSTLTMHRGGPPLGGFVALPSEFSPSFMVALDGTSPNQLAYAARVVSAVARLTSRQLTPQVVDLKAAADATSGALIVASSAAIQKTSLNPPVGGDGSAVDVALPTELRANIDHGLGSIQAFADPQRYRSVVLVTTTGGWTLVDPLFSYIDGLGGGWSQLTGDVLAAGAAGTPVNLSIRGEDEGNGFLAPTPPSAGFPWIGIGIGVGVAVVVLGAALLWRRRRTPS
jgi:hypothetical protein